MNNSEKNTEKVCYEVRELISEDMVILILSYSSIIF